jgi:hypothetical protein
VETDAHGRFRFEHLPGDEGAEIASDDDSVVLVDAHFPIRPGARDVVLHAVGVEESARYHVEVVLIDAATGESASALDMAGIDLLPAGGEPGPRMTMQQSRGLSEPGRFVSHSPVAPGLYDVVVKAQGWRSATIRGFRIPWQGSAPAVRLERGAAVRGRVTDTAGRALAGVRVRVGESGATTDAEGGYVVFGLDAGEHDADASGDLVVRSRRRVQVPAAGAVDVDWRLDRGGSVRVEPRHDGAGPRPSLLLRRLSDGAEISDVGRLDGTWFPSLSPGAYRLEATGADGTQVEVPVEVLAGEVTVVALPGRPR